MILDTLDPRQESSESASSWSLSALDEVASRVHLSSLDFASSSARVVAQDNSSSSSVNVGAGSRTRLQLSLTQESSLDLESSQLSQDSSNGSISQTEDLNEEEVSALSLASDVSLRLRTVLDSPMDSNPLVGGVSAGASVVLTPSSSVSSGRALGTSVIVGGRADSSAVGGGGGGRSRGTLLQSPSREEAAATSEGKSVFRIFWALAF